MKCKFCNTENANTNKFCIRCGEELETEIITTTSNCNNCGTKNDNSDQFCTNCGTKLKEEEISKRGKNSSNYNSNKSKKKSSKNKNNTHKRKSDSISIKPMLITVGIVIITIIIATSFDLIFHKYPDNTIQYQTENRSNNPVLEANVIDIASKFICACGTCNEQPLDTCGCPTAIEEREYIRQELNQNISPDNIITAVANKYGWLKAEFASKYKIDKSRTWSNNNLTSQKSQVTNNLLSNDANTRPATLADRNLIMSKFRCPCGQCNIDELLDCNCQHPGGATEIKTYITNSILSGKKTVAQIVEEVNNKYGGEK